MPSAEWPPPYLRGTWYARRLKRGVYSRRPHYYVFGDQRSLCEHSTREKGDLVFNPDTGRTMEVDPLIGDYQVRRACGTCTMLIEKPESSADMINKIGRQIAEMIPVQSYGLA